MTQKLMPDSQAPVLSLPLVGGGTWSLANQTQKTSRWWSSIVAYIALYVRCI